MHTTIEHPKTNAQETEGDALQHRVHDDVENVVHNNESETSHSLNIFEPLPELSRPHRRRKIILWLGVALAVLDLCILPMTYFYALKYGTSLSLQDSMYPFCQTRSPVLMRTSIRCNNGSIRYAKLWALWSSITEALPCEDFFEMETCRMDKMGHGMSWDTWQC